MKIFNTAAKGFVGVGLTLALGVVSAADSVGTLSRIQGVAFVSQGAQYVAGREGMALKEGDRLMVMDGGNAVISFSDGCRYDLADNEVLTIGAASTCASETESSYKVDPYVTVSQDPAATPDSIRLASAQVGGAGAMPAWVIPAGLIGGLAIMGAAADLGSDDRDNRLPPSP